MDRYHFEYSPHQRRVFIYDRHLGHGSTKDAEGSTAIAECTDVLMAGRIVGLLNLSERVEFNEGSVGTSQACADNQ